MLNLVHCVNNWCKGTPSFRIFKASYIRSKFEPAGVTLSKKLDLKLCCENVFLCIKISGKAKAESGLKSLASSVPGMTCMG